MPSRDLVRRIARWAEVLLVFGVIVFWFLELRPQGLGGPAGYALVNGESMEPGYRTGDIVIVHRRPSYKVGEVVAYRVPEGSVGAGAQVIHRLTGGDGVKGFIAQGDNRTAPDVWRPTNKDIVGSAWLHIPKLGVAVKLLNTPLFLGLLAAAVAILSVLFHKQKDDHKAAPALPTFAATPNQRLMLAVTGTVPEGMPLCSRGCHVLLHGARFDPHTGERLVRTSASPAVQAL